MNKNTSDIINHTSEQKTLSFIVPLYNSAKWLEKCLLSIIDQDIPEKEMEIICVNDGSPDNSAELAREIGKKHLSIIVIDQPNQGPSGARNTGMKAATGKYLCFVDPDDFVEPNVYGKLVQQMEDEQLDMLRFNYRIVDENYQHVEKRPFEKVFDYSPKLMTGAEFIATRLDIACHIWKYMYRREIITRNEIWCFTGDYYDDTPWLPLVLLKAERMSVCDTVVYDYLDRSDSLVQSRSPKMMKRKADGVIILLKYLETELAVINKTKLVNEKRFQISVADKWRDGVVRWYQMMKSISVMSLLSNLSSALYSERKYYLNQLSSFNLFPLSTNKANRSNRIKIWVANISPILFCHVSHIYTKYFYKK